MQQQFKPSNMGMVSPQISFPTIPNGHYQLQASFFVFIIIMCCSCKTNCSSSRCTCKKQGLKSPVACGDSRGLKSPVACGDSRGLKSPVACGDSRGVSCSNSPAPAMSLEDCQNNVKCYFYARERERERERERGRGRGIW